MKMSKKAFTLVEMLIVIVIIGILAAALIPRLTGIQGRARDTARETAVGQLNSAVQLYSVDYSKFPPTLTKDHLGTGYLSTFPTNGGFHTSSDIADCKKRRESKAEYFAYGTGNGGYSISAGLEADNGGNANDCSVATPTKESVGNQGGIFKIYSK